MPKTLSFRKEKVCKKKKKPPLCLAVPAWAYQYADKYKNE